MSVEFWHGIVEINQVPKVKDSIDKEKSWLFDPLGDERIYTTQFRLEPNHFSWKFFLKEESEKEALVSAHQFLDTLRELFPGLTGTVSSKAITYIDLIEKKKLIELVLPRPTFETGKKLNIIGKIFDTFFFNSNEIITVFIIWQIDDSLSLKSSNIYKVKIFLEIESPHENYSAELEGHLKHLAANIKNFRGDEAYFQQAHPIMWRSILENGAMYQNIDNDAMGIYYKDALRAGDIRMDWGIIPGFVEPEQVDFTIHENNPLKKAVGLQHENVGFGSLSEADKTAIQLPLGYYINRNGEVTKTIIPLFLNDLLCHAFITGRTGLGKTRLIAYLVDQVTKMAPHTGILVILLRKESDKNLYTCDLELKYPDLEIPYFFSYEVLSRHIPSMNWSKIIKLIRENTQILSSSVGLTGIFFKNLNTVEKKYFKTHMEPPLNLENLFKMWYGYFKKYPYPGDFGGAALRAIRNRKNDLLLDSDLSDIVKLTPQLPVWLERFMKGESVLLDLTDCDKEAHLLVINLILQMIKIFISDTGINELKYLVAIDEIGEVSTEVKFKGLNDDDVISKSQVGEHFSELLKSYRSRGVGSIFSGHDVVTLTRAFYSDPNISMVFALKQDSGKLFSIYPETQEILALLGKRRLYYLNSIRNQKFLLYTIDFNGDML